MHAIGASALRRAWVVALYIVSLAFLRMRLGRQEMDRSAERGIYAVFGLVSTALLALLYALLTDDFHLRYVATVSHRAMSTFYVITGLWGGQENLMLLWLWLLALYSTLDLLQRLLQAPRDGRDLNPLLQHPLMVLHPPMLSLGTEWRTSRYADHPGNPSFDPKFKRDCQTCHMQQDYGHPGTAQRLYTGTGPQAPLTGKVWPGGADRPVFYSHHCIGGNSYIPRRPGVVNANGLPINTHGTVVESHNPLGQPQYPDRDGDLFDEVYHVDTRLQPLPHAGATMHLDRYAVVVPSGTRGPVAVTVAVYYQPFAAVATQKLLENLAGTDLDGMLEPCVLKGTRDGRWSTVKPAVGEGAPPVPVQITSRMTPITRTADAPPSTATTYLRADATEVYEDVVVEVFFSEPVTGVDVTTMPLTDAQGTVVPASVAQTAMTPGGSSRIRSFCGGERPIAPVWPPRCVHFAQNCLGQALT